MAKRKSVSKKEEKCDCGCACCGNGKVWKHHMHCKGGVIYGLGFIGALVFYLQQASGFWTVILGILKAIVWPAMLVFKLLGL